MTKTSNRRVRCMVCGEQYHGGKDGKKPCPNCPGRKTKTKKGQR